ncbi:hypothetical protein ACIGEZ_18445 [Streptomyces sp. NPDC085481]|uniref:hypothetical protein n=1 Tax=Streptomyces sp. NPDC085481 TaxID=3365727 RepID=UPI0037D6ED40
MTPGRCSRGVRAALFAAVCVLLAATGHVLMSGQGVPARTVLPAFVVTMAAAWTLAGRERGLPAVTTMSVLVQSALHTVFSWSPPATVPAPAAGAAMTTGDVHAAHTHMSHAAMGHGDMTAVADMTATADVSSSFGMLSAHLLAALLSGLWMAYGERAVFRLLRAAPLRLFRPLRLLVAAFVPVVRDRPRLLPVRAGDERAPRRLLLAHSVISRGPPQGLAVL